MKRLFYILIVTIVLASCQRKELDPITTEVPEFFARGILAGDSYDVSAGVNDYYLEAAYARNDLGVFEYTANFRKSNLGVSSLKICIQDDQRTLPVHSSDIDNSLSLGSYEYQTDTMALNSNALQFYSFAGEDKNYTWLINGVEYSENYPIHDLEEGVPLSVFLVVENMDGTCSDTISREVEYFDNTGDYHNYFYENFTWNIENSNGKVKFDYDGDLEEVNSITWSVVENGAVFSDNGTSFVHDFSVPIVHKVIMNVTMNNGYQFRYSENIDPFGTNGCAASIMFERIPLYSDFDTSKVRVEYTDEEGSHYSSFSPSVDENPERNFDVLNITAYSPNLQGQETRKLNIELSCTLYNTDDPSDTIQLEDFESTLAVSFPQ